MTPRLVLPHSPVIITTFNLHIAIRDYHLYNPTEQRLARMIAHILRHGKTLAKDARDRLIHTTQFKNAFEVEEMLTAITAFEKLLEPNKKNNKK